MQDFYSYTEYFYTIILLLENVYKKQKHDVSYPSSKAYIISIL